jgi:hypothetical protein
MYLKLKTGVLKEIINTSFKKVKDVKKFAKKIRIPKSTLYLYRNEKRLISEKNLKKLQEFTNIQIQEEDIAKKFPDNWKQIIGGKKCTEKKRINNTLNTQLEKARKKISFEKSAKAWHIRMKRDNPDEYHMIQYERFKKIGGYKFITKKGEKVRNLLEKQTADILFDNKIEYKYEPMIRFNKKYFFPDFLIKPYIIIECTAWRGFDKATKLRNKIDCLKGKYRVFVLIPKALNNYYKILNNHLVLGLDEFVPLAQTFRDAK